MRLTKLWLSIAIAVLVTLPAVYLRLAGVEIDPLWTAAIFGMAILSAGFMLSWGAESAEGQISSGLILAIVALVTVLPEYAVDIYYAFRAGQQPDSNYVHYAAANMTGANRLLVGIGWPLLVLIHWWRTRERAISLTPVNGVEIAFLLLPTLYAFVILLRNQIGLFDAAVLIAIFGLYVWRVSRLPQTESEEDEEEESEPGLAAAIEQLPTGQQWALMGALTFVAAAVIFLSAGPFADGIVESGRALGINEFLLIQWLAPLASEAPAVTVAILFVLSLRAPAGLTTMISDKINQWTLLVGMLPLAMSVGAGSLTALPLDARQHEEFFLTAAQSLFGIVLLLRLRLSLGGAAALGLLFLIQVSLAFTFRDDEARTIQTLTWLSWAYIGLALAIAAANLQRLALIKTGLFGERRSR
ncbi:MAG: sodium:proton exchanger [Pseudomonadota bacterium]